jgi:hypothetical protein
VHSSWSAKPIKDLAFGTDMGVSLFGFEHDKTFMGLENWVFSM